MRELQTSYNSEYGAAIDVDGVVGPQTWGAFIDAIQTRAPKQALSTLPRIEVRLGKNFAPHIVARDATGDDARYTEMNPYNPSKPYPDGGWRDTWPGETVLLPPEWDGLVENLIGNGWDAHHGEPRAAPPTTPGPRCLPMPGPPAVACGAHHLDSPRLDPEYRASARHVEVLFFDEPPGAIACGPGSGPCPSSRCEVYDPRDYDLNYIDGDLILGHVPLYITVSRLGRDATFFVLLVEDGAGATHHVVGKEVADESECVTWAVRPDDLPNPARLVLVEPGRRSSVGQAFDPTLLRDALLRRDLNAASLIWDPREDTP